MLCAYLQTFESALFLEEKEHQIKLMTLWKSQRRSTPDCLINISHRILTIKEEEALRCGLKHHILPRSVNDISVKTAIEKQIYYIKKDIALLIITMVILKCYFSREYIALSHRKLCEHGIMKNQQIKGTAHDGKSYLK